MKTILVATDFSPAALNAANYAADMAVAIHANILLLYVYHMPDVYSEVPLTGDDEDVIGNVEISMIELKRDLIIRTKSKAIIGTQIRMGAFFEELQTVCEQMKPYTVVMGSQGKSAAERMVFGGHTVYASKHLMWPLITVPTGAGFSSIKKIGFACDLNEVASSTPVDEIKRLVTDFNAKLLVLNIGRKDVFHPDLVSESETLQKILEPVKASCHFITHENADKGIIDFVEKSHIDLLVVLPKRRGLLELFHKSHSKQLVLHSHV